MSLRRARKITAIESELSPARVNHRQLQRALAHHRDPSLPTEFD
jgi:hypothetical protein